MTQPLIRFDDAQLATRDALRALLAERDEPEAAGATVSTRDPVGSTREDTALPHVKVATLTAPRGSRLDVTPSVRVTVWHRDEGLALALAGLIEALLLRGVTAGPIRRFNPDGGPVPVPGGDPDTGLPMAFITLTARMRPRQTE